MGKVETGTLSRWQVWMLASRPKTLWASIAPVLMGTAMAFADGKGHWLAALAALAGAVLIQIGTNLANDYYDYLKGADSTERLGPLRVTQAGLVSPQTMRFAFMLTFALAFLVGLYLIYRGGWPILVIGILSILMGIAYTAGPLPLGYTGLADLFVLIFFGPVAVGGTYYVQALSLPGYVVIAGLAPGLLSTALLTVNNLRDIETDQLAGKKTLAVRFGKSFAQWEYVFCLLVAILIPFYLLSQLHGHYGSAAVVLTLFYALPAVRMIFSFQDPRQLNEVLGKTGQSIFLYAVLFSAGWLVNV